MSSVPELSLKDKRLIKGALRRIFPRLDHYEHAISKNFIEHADPIGHPQCKKWSWCSICGEVVPRWTTDLDHIEPVLPVTALDESIFTAEQLMARIICDLDKYQVLCARCHTDKTTAENKLRTKKPRKPRKPKTLDTSAALVQSKSKGELTHG